MSNQDSFVEEVTEELRRDRLYAAYRRYGWIAAILVVVIVGGAAANEWRKARAEATAQAYGDALFAALSIEDDAARSAALAAVETPPQAAPLSRLLEAASAGADAAEQVAALQALAADPDTPEMYRQFARLRLAIAGSEILPAAERLAALDTLSGTPFGALAAEQRALIQIETGDAAAAVETLTGVMGMAEATEGQRQRALQLLIAVGGADEQG